MIISPLYAIFPSFIIQWHTVRIWIHSAFIFPQVTSYAWQQYPLTIGRESEAAPLYACDLLAEFRGWAIGHRERKAEREKEDGEGKWNKRRRGALLQPSVYSIIIDTISSYKQCRNVHIQQLHQKRNRKHFIFIYCFWYYSSSATTKWLKYLYLLPIADKKPKLQIIQSSKSQVQQEILQIMINPMYIPLALFSRLFLQICRGGVV